MRGPLRLLGLLGLLVGSPAVATPENPALTEAELLHRRLPLDGLSQWNAASQRFVPLTERPAAKVTVLHLWSPHCVPCVAELPLLQRLLTAWRSEPSVRFLLVADFGEDSDGSDVVSFVASHRGQFPSGPLLRLRDPRLREALSTSIQPLTLLLDEKLVVRQAFAGPLTGRNVGTAVTRLLSALR